MFPVLEQRIVAPVLKSRSVVVILSAEAEVEPKPGHQALQGRLGRHQRGYVFFMQTGTWTFEIFLETIETRR